MILGNIGKVTAAIKDPRRPPSAAALVAAALLLGAAWITPAAGAVDADMAPAAVPPTATPSAGTAAAEGAAAETAGAGKAQVGAQVTVEDLQSLLSALENPAERERLAAQLRALIAAKKEAAPKEEAIGARVLDVLSERIATLSNQFTSAAAALLNAPALFHWLSRQVSDEYTRGRMLEILAKLGVILGAGVGAAALARLALRRPRRAAERAEHVSRIVRWLLLAARTAIEIAPVAVFAAACYVVLPFTAPSATTRAIALAIVNAVVLTRVIIAAAFLVLSPSSWSLRLLPFSDETAEYAYIWVRRLATLAIYGYFAAQAALLLGLPAAGYATVLNALGLVIAAMLVILVLQNRHEVADWIRGAGPEAAAARATAVQSLRRLLADLWHILAILYVASIYSVWALRIEGGFQFVLAATLLTVVILALARLLAAVSDRAIARGFSVSDDVKRLYPTLEERANRYLPILNAVAKFAIYGVAGLALLQVWGLQAIGWVTSDIGRELTATVITIALALAVALALWEMAGLYMESYLARAEMHGEPEEKRARIRTMMPLARNALLVVLVTMVGLIVLAQLGINIAPLLAGAGIIGLAVGFGAQKMVQDVFTGMFVFLEAAVAVGDVVELGGHSGVVEAMSIRSIRLRDLEGNVHTIPFSAVSTVMNYTKDFSYYMFDVGVGYGENTDRVVTIMREVADGMRNDKHYASAILESLDVLGLDRFADSAVVIKARIKTMPGRQWMVGREFNRRLKMRFDEVGIEIPFPQRTITFAGAIPFPAEAGKGQ
jgi:small conductance mechanosensitive channel